MSDSNKPIEVEVVQNRPNGEAPEDKLAAIVKESSHAVARGWDRVVRFFSNGN